jgi:hypothetical protein
VEVLGEQEKIGFKELKRLLGLGVGTVSVIALVVLVVRWLRRPLNIVGA